jgi:hypothetical protein
MFWGRPQAVQHKAAMQPTSNSSSKKCHVATICMQQPQPAALCQGRVASPSIRDLHEASTAHALCSSHCTLTRYSLDSPQLFHLDVHSVGDVLPCRTLSPPHQTTATSTALSTVDQSVQQPS